MHVCYLLTTAVEWNATVHRLYATKDGRFIELSDRAVLDDSLLHCHLVAAYPLCSSKLDSIS
jgi:hypothetical protein